jgi:hypothetical protein
MTLFRDHLSFAHACWRRLVQPGDIVVDATLGNGQDAAVLGALCLEGSTGALWGLDVQQAAIDASQETLRQRLTPTQMEQVHLELRSHETFPEELQPGSVRLFVYNLGYLPGGDPMLITQSETTIQSLQAACALLTPGGMISCTCYPGHPGGEREEAAVVSFASSLPRRFWTVQHIRWLNRRRGPSLVLIERLSD